VFSTSFSWTDKNGLIHSQYSANTVFIDQIFCLYTSVVDPDPKGSEPFCRIRIRIRIIGLDPEPKGSEYICYYGKLDLSCFKGTILSLSTHILTLKLVEKRTSVSKIAFSQWLQLLF